MLLRARILAPISGPPVADGVVSIAGDRLLWAGPRQELPASARTTPEVDLGDVLLMPGLINAHAHLDYTDLAGVIPPPKGFTEWIQAMVASKADWNIERFRASWLRGAEMLVRTGTTTALDVEAVMELQPACWEATPLRVFSFRELIHLQPRRDPAELVERAVNDWLGMPQGQGRVGLSPHAPYTTTAEFLELAARAAQRRQWRLVTHVAESEQEFEMFMYRHGPMYDWLRTRRDVSDCGLGSPVQHLERCGYLDRNVIAVHVNYLGPHDAGILGRNEVSVVHCPRSHDYFRHLSFPREELERAGVNICLGTDSLATVRMEGDAPPELSMFAEMQAVAGRAPGLDPEAIVRMATVNGAHALGRAGQLGELTAGAYADLIAIPFTGSLRNAAAAIVGHGGAVGASMIGGRWVVGP
jgi:cytosine/adenosine deaminase-related metal-dependent hydrolase